MDEWLATTCMRRHLRSEECSERWQLKVGGLAGVEALCFVAAASRPLEFQTFQVSFG